MAVDTDQPALRTAHVDLVLRRRGVDDGDGGVEPQPNGKRVDARLPLTSMRCA